MRQKLRKSNGSNVVARERKRHCRVQISKSPRYNHQRDSNQADWDRDDDQSARNTTQNGFNSPEGPHTAISPSRCSINSSKLFSIARGPYCSQTAIVIRCSFWLRKRIASSNSANRSGGVNYRDLIHFLEFGFWCGVIMEKHVTLGSDWHQILQPWQFHEQTNCYITKQRLNRDSACSIDEVLLSDLRRRCI